MPGIDPEFICHRRHINFGSKEHAEAVKVEVNKLQQAGEFKKVFYPK